MLKLLNQFHVASVALLCCVQEETQEVTISDFQVRKVPRDWKYDP